MARRKPRPFKAYLIRKLYETPAMKPVLDETHDAQVQSWVESANVADSDCPIQNLPFGVFRRQNAGSEARAGVAIGDPILAVSGIRTQAFLSDQRDPLPG